MARKELVKAAKNFIDENDMGYMEFKIYSNLVFALEDFIQSEEEKGECSAESSSELTQATVDDEGRNTSRKALLDVAEKFQISQIPAEEIEDKVDSRFVSAMKCFVESEEKGSGLSDSSEKQTEDVQMSGSSEDVNSSDLRRLCCYSPRRVISNPTCICEEQYKIFQNCVECYMLHVTSEHEMVKPCNGCDDRFTPIHIRRERKKWTHDVEGSSSSSSQSQEQSKGEKEKEKKEEKEKENEECNCNVSLCGCEGTFKYCTVCTIDFCPFCECPCRDCKCACAKCDCKGVCHFCRTTT